MKLHCRDCGDFVKDKSGWPIEFDQPLPGRCDSCEQQHIERENKGRRVPWDIYFDMPAGSPQRQ